MTLVELPAGLYPPATEGDVSYADAERIQNQLYQQFNIEVSPVPEELQALVYDILPSTTAVFSYAIGSRKLSANEQFFVGAQTIISLLQTTRII